MLKTFMERYPNARLAPGQGELDFEWNHHNARRINRLVVDTGLDPARRAA